MTHASPELSPEDAKLVTLARSTRARTRAAEGAAVRDLDGRTYAAATVALEALQVSAVGVAVAMAISSGSRGLEAVVLLTDGELTDSDRAVVAEFSGAGVPILVNPAR
ncbi:cytidine deaminase [Nocardioides baekrokdamisoli]|uniref:Cytidine deaminase n=1 Tax=Nocardioides baekrokdamisoli TaxID=1804624 RepID=A0A3G9IV15_9ACTN|nr:cytidine deaminase [Nocardioides baekrokdamisoli]BBH16083.1 cytidine deaminase [Nocardioides baekrokdamisoli]